MRVKQLRTRYGTILADPPWPERGGGRIKRGADGHYDVMRVSGIIALMVQLAHRYALPDSHLYLWVTNNYLEHGLAVMRACGFRYVTTITWLKDKVGLGQYYRGVTEHCLFGIRGRPGYRYQWDGRRAQGRTGFTAVRTDHSRKPEQIHVWAEVVSPGPYIELFARHRRPGWAVWGREVNKEG